MGWASGSGLLNEIWEKLRPEIPEHRRVFVCVDLMRAFEQEDCDTLDECFHEDWPEMETAYYEIHPDYRDEP